MIILSHLLTGIFIDIRSSSSFGLFFFSQIKLVMANAKYMSKNSQASGQFNVPAGTKRTAIKIDQPIIILAAIFLLAFLRSFNVSPQLWHPAAWPTQQSGSMGCAHQNISFSYLLIFMFYQGE
jgi:hypothetical protein